MGKRTEKIKPLDAQSCIEIFFAVWGGKSVRQACENDTIRGMFYVWCELNQVKPPRKGDLIKKHESENKKAAKRLTKKALSNESLSSKIREGIYKFANMDSSWAKTGIAFLESDAKGKSGTVTAEEYGAFIEKLFQPHKITCSECGAVNDAKKTKPLSTSTTKKSRKSNKTS